MSHEAIGKIMDRWTNDSTFRSQMRANPEGAIKNCGVTLAPDELATLRNIDWRLSDEQLQMRASKI